MRIYGSGIQLGNEAKKPSPALGNDAVTDAECAQLVQTIEEFRATSANTLPSGIEGNLFALAVAIKTNVATEGQTFDSPDIVALQTSLDTLGYSSDDLCVIVLSAGEWNVQKLRQAIELIDPMAVVALDADAGVMVRSAYEEFESQGKLKPEGAGQSDDHMEWICGRRHVYLHDFSTALDSIDAKRAAWAALRELRREQFV